MTRKSTQLHEVYFGPTVVVSGKSRTHCDAVAKEMNRGKAPMFRVSVRPVMKDCAK